MKDKESTVCKKIIGALAKNKYVLVVVLAGLLLLLLPIGSEQSSKSESAARTGVSSNMPEFSLYEQEERISGALSEIAGAGRVSVVLTLKASAGQVLATDKRASGKNGDMGTDSFDASETTVVITAGSQIEKPVTLKYIYPEYLGALVVADGADNAQVRLELLEAVAGLTGLSADRITVTKMKNS